MPALSTASGKMPNFSSAAVCFSLGRSHLPSEGRHIARQVFGLDRSFHIAAGPPAFACAAAFPRAALPGLPPAGRQHPHCACSAACSISSGHPACARFSVIFSGNFPVFADDVRGAAQLMAFREPQKIKQKQILFARLRRQARAAPNHLAVQAAHFGGAQHYDAVYTEDNPSPRSAACCCTGHCICRLKNRTEFLPGPRSARLPLPHGTPCC